MSTRQRYMTPRCKKQADLIRTSQEIYRRNQITITQSVAAAIGTTAITALQVQNANNNVANVLNRAIIQTRRRR